MSRKGASEGKDLSNYTNSRAHAQLLSQDLRFILVENRIRRQNRHLFHVRLRDEQTVKRISVVHRQIAQCINVARFNEQNLDFIALSFKSYNFRKGTIQLKLFNAQLNLNFLNAGHAQENFVI